jgi:transcriptional regulator with XRE-family HTH domain
VREVVNERAGITEAAGEKLIDALILLAGEAVDKTTGMGLVRAQVLKTKKDKIREKFRKGDLTFAGWFDQILVSAGISQRSIAKEVGILEATVSKIMSESNNVSKQTAVRMIAAANKLAGKEIADKRQGLLLQAGLWQQDDVMKIGNSEEYIELENYTLPEAIRKVELLMVRNALRKTNGNQTKAAEVLGIPPHSIRYYMEKFNLK